MGNTTLIVAVFPSRNILVKALKHLMERDDFPIKRAAIVAKAKSGETVILGEEITPDEGGIAGGTLGAAIAALGLVQWGALALPGVGPIIALGAGALVGGLVGRATGRFAANLLDAGFKDEQIVGLADHLEAGHPALVLEMELAEPDLPPLRQVLRSLAAELVEPLHKMQTGPLKPPPAIT